MTDIPPFDLGTYLGKAEWTDQGAQLDTTVALMAVVDKLNELIMKVNRMERDTEEPLGS